MTLQSFIPLVPFLALLYVAFALAETLRRRRQGGFASILALVALVALVAPLAAYLLAGDAAIRSSLLMGIAINAVLVFVASLVTLLIERRGKTLDPNHSFGILGIGLSVLLAVVMFGAPLFPTASAGLSAVVTTTDTSTTTASNNAANTVLISAEMPAVVVDAAIEDTAADDTISNGAFAPPEMTPGAAMMPPPDMSAADDSVSLETTEEAVAPVIEQQPAQVEPTAVSTEATAGDTIARPTRIVFPTATPTPDATEESAADAQPEMSAQPDTSAQADASCALVVDFNLNLRTLPTTEGSTVLLSIPFGTSVLADSRSADGWYHVSYDGQTGWVSGTYVTAGIGCDALPVVTES